MSDKIAIMVRGELRALGPSQTLKSTYGAGYLSIHGQWWAGCCRRYRAHSRRYRKPAADPEGIKEEPSGTLVKDLTAEQRHRSGLNLELLNQVMRLERGTNGSFAHVLNATIHVYLSVLCLSVCKCASLSVWDFTLHH